MPDFEKRQVLTLPLSIDAVKRERAHSDENDPDVYNIDHDRSRHILM